MLGALALTATLSLAWGAGAPAGALAQTAPQQAPGGAAWLEDADEATGAVAAALARTEWRVLNLHRHGIGLRAEKGGGPFDRAPTRRVLVVDLGPGVPHLQQDVPPMAASISVNGQGPLAFEMVSEGVLEARVPTAWLHTWSANDVEIGVWGPQGESLVDFDAALPGLL